MQALMIEGVERSAVRNIEEPKLGEGDVLLDVKHVGLCGSDLATFIGMNPLVSLPRIPGHEIGAEIAATGSGVPAECAPRKRVIVIPYTACGKCTSCRAGRTNACRYNRTLGVQQNGGLAERIVLPYGKLIVNDTLAARHLALVEPLSVGFHAVARGRVKAGEYVAIIGCGMIGMGAVAGAVAAGAQVIAIDLGSKTQMALRYGAKYAIDAGREDVPARIDEITDGDGVHVAIEAVGLPQTFTQAIDIACFCGRVVYIGYSKAPVTYDTKFFNMKELDIHGSRNASIQDFHAVIRYLEKSGHNPDDLISKVFPFAEAATALPYWKQARASTLKVLVER